MEVIKVTTLLYRDKKCLALTFRFNSAIQQRLKQMNATWSASNKAWMLQDTPEDRNRLLALKDIASFEIVTSSQIATSTPTVVSPPISDETKHAIEKYTLWLKSRRYSSSTIKTYTEALQSFLKFYAHKSINDISHQDVIVFNNEYILKNKLSASYQNQVVNAVKLFFMKMENKQMDVDLIHRPKREKILPNVLSKEEVKAILNAHHNIKHKTMLSIIYSCGLRRSELLHLKPNDIDAKRNIIIIRQAKGKKDRIAPLSEKIVTMLREYYLQYKPTTWLFEGQTAGEQYDERSLANVLKQAVEKAGINKPVSLHWLRHSYATHLLAAGTDLRYIQEILGHKSSKTTEIYTHVSTKNIQNIKSPFDDL